MTRPDSDAIQRIMDRQLDAYLDEGENHHASDCPLAEDADEVFECGGHNEHFCTWAEREINGCAVVIEKCSCPTAEDIASDKADAAEARRDALEDR